MALVKIARILSRMNIGGPAVHAALLTRELHNEEFESFLVTGTIDKAEGNMLYLAERLGVHPVVIPELGREISPKDDLVALWKLYRFFVTERPDIVHTHTAKAGTLGRIAALLAGVRIRIHTFHGHVFHGYFGRMKTVLFILIERALAKLTTVILAISPSQAADLSRRYRIASPEKIRVLPLGLDLEPLLRVPVRTQASEDDRKRAVGFVGRLVPIKNPTLAVQVFERLYRNRPEQARYRLIFAGDGELKDALKERVEGLRLRDHVEFAGWLDDLPTFYQGIDVVLLTSINEGTPVALIEAMAAARPFVAARVGGVADLMTGSETVIPDQDGAPLFSLFANGVLVPPSRVDGFAAGLAHLLADRALMADMGLAGRHFVSERYSTRRLVADMADLYRECLGKKASYQLQAGCASSLAERPSSGRKVGV